MDPLFRACPGQLSHPSYLHSQVSSADYGLPDQRLLLQTAGKSSVPMLTSSVSFLVWTGENQRHMTHRRFDDTLNQFKIKAKLNASLHCTFKHLNGAWHAFLFLFPWQKLSPEKVYHVLVAPCFDKKLEAVREEFYNSLLETRDVDCVLTSGRLTSSPQTPANRNTANLLFKSYVTQK